MHLPAADYMTDAAQRFFPFWDVMRERANQYREHMAETAPNVLEYAVKLLIEGSTLARPVNYALVRVVPPAGVEINSKQRSFVIVDPRADSVRTRMASCAVAALYAHARRTGAPSPGA